GIIPPKCHHPDRGQKMSDIVKFNVRLPKGLHRRLQRDAAKNNVSLNTEIVNRLEGSRAALVRDLVEAARPELKDIAAEVWFDRAAEPAAPAQRSAADTAEGQGNLEHAVRAIHDRLEALSRQVRLMEIEREKGAGIRSGQA